MRHRRRAAPAGARRIARAPDLSARAGLPVRLLRQPVRAGGPGADLSAGCDAARAQRAALACAGRGRAAGRRADHQDGARGGRAAVRAGTGAGQARVDRDRRHRGCGWRGRGPGCGSGRRRVLAVHVRIDRDAARRGAHAPQLAAQLGAHPRGVRLRARQPRRHLASAVSRHGADRRHPAAALRRHRCGADVAAGLPRPPDALAGGDLAHARGSQRRAQLRLRSVRAQEQPGRAGATRSVVVGGGLQRRRAGARRDAGPLRRGVRAGRLPRRGAVSVLRAGRVDADRDRRAAADGGADGAGRARRAGPGARGRGRRGWWCGAGRGCRAGRLRARVRRRRDRDRGRGDRPALRTGRAGRDLAGRRQRGGRLLRPAGGDRARVRRQDRRRRGTVPAHRRPRLRPARRAVRRRAARGPHHRARPQSPRRRSGAHRRAGPGRPPSRMLGRVPGRRRRSACRAGGRGRARPGARPGRPVPRPAPGRGRGARAAAGRGGAGAGRNRSQDVERKDRAPRLPARVRGRQPDRGGPQRPGGRGGRCDPFGPCRTAKTRRARRGDPPAAR